MAKEYSYYIEGNKVAIVERDTAFDNNVDSKEYGPGVSRAMWKSPQSSVADALEIKYAHSPDYFIETTNDVDENITQYQSTDGCLSIADNSSAYINYATTYALAADKYIVLRNAGQFNGLHKIKALSNNTGTNNKITLYTKYSGSEAAWSTFEETPKLYYAVDVLNDEEDELDLPSYLQKALVYYLKARNAEDVGNMELKEYMMREYKKHIEQYESTLMKGPRIISSGFHAIR
tara:strand:- start:2225 stop:2923 length:699 start_codon:yes stop_codon:yes gene_type:complete